MEFSCKLFILVLLLPIIGRCSAYFSHHKCSKEYDITSNYKLKQTIGQVISDLLLKKEEGFAVAIRPMDLEAIYGLIQCRGDINIETCSSCILKATQKLQKICPSSAEAQIWLDECTMRYGSDNFIGQADTSYARFWPSPKPTINSIDFETSVDRAMQVAKIKAMNANNKFGAMSINVVNSDLIVYVMAQCTRDLSELTCGQCIDSSITIRSTSCKAREGCRVISPGCMVREEIYNFLLSPII